VETNPYLYVWAANGARRHLTDQERREATQLLIQGLIGENPQKSDREIAKMIGVSHHTVGKVRDQAVSSGQIGPNEHLPGARAEAVAEENPNASVDEIAEKADVSRATASRAKKRLAEGLPPEQPKSADLEQEAEKFQALVLRQLLALNPRWLDKLGADLMHSKIESALWSWDLKVGNLSF
jgi:transposase